MRSNALETIGGIQKERFTRVVGGSVHCTRSSGPEPNKITKIESELFLDHPNEEDASFDFDSVGQFNCPVALQQ